jgi:hypothetical protein
MPHAGAPVGAHHDEVHLLLARHTQDLLSRFADRHPDLHRHSLLEVFVSEVMQFRLRPVHQVDDDWLPPERLTAHRHPFTERRRRADKSCPFREHLLYRFRNDMQQQEPRHVFPRQTCAPLQCLLGVIGIVHRRQDLFDIHVRYLLRSTPTARTTRLPSGEPLSRSSGLTPADSPVVEPHRTHRTWPRQPR